MFPITTIKVSPPPGSDHKKIYLEVLRIIALFFVLYNHTASYGWLMFRDWPTFLSDAPSKLELCINVVLFVLCKLSVPLFLMISGAVLLGKSESISALLKKRVSRFIILIIVITVVRGFYLYLIKHSALDGISTISDFLRKAWSTPDLFCTYYLFLYVGFLLALPLFRMVAQKRELIPYMVALYILFQEVLPVFQSILNLENNNMYPYIGAFSAYYVLPLLGYYIDTIPDSSFSKKKCNIILLMAGELLLSVGIAYWYSSAKDMVVSWLTCLFPACVMYFFRNNIHTKGSISVIILKVSPLVFGALLLSGDIGWWVFPVYQNLISWMPAQLASLIWTLLTFIVSLCGCALLRCIPALKKLI